MDFKIEFYESQSGKKVVEEELEEVEKQTPVLHALLLTGLNKLQHSEYHKPPLSESLGNGLFELRVGRSNIARAIWFFMQDQRIIVVRCFLKKQQKIRENDLKLAQTRMNDHLQRHG